MPFNNPATHSLGGKASSGNMTEAQLRGRGRYAIMVRRFGKRSHQAREALAEWQNAIEVAEKSRQEAAAA